MTIIKFLSKLVNKNFEFNGSISMDKMIADQPKNNNDIDIYNNKSISSCNNTPQPSPQHPLTQFNQPDFFEEITREDDSRLLMAYSSL